MTDALGLDHALDLRDAMAPLVAAIEEAQGEALQLNRMSMAAGGGGSAVHGSGGASSAATARSVLASLSTSLSHHSYGPPVTPRAAGHASHYSSIASAAVHPTTIWGPTCDSIDKITDVAQLPEAHIGDWFVFENMVRLLIPCSREIFLCYLFCLCRRVPTLQRARASLMAFRSLARSTST